MSCHLTSPFLLAWRAVRGLNCSFQPNAVGKQPSATTAPHTPQSQTCPSKPERRPHDGIFKAQAWTPPGRWRPPSRANRIARANSFSDDGFDEAYLLTSPIRFLTAAFRLTVRSCFARAMRNRRRSAFSFLTTTSVRCALSHRSEPLRLMAVMALPRGNSLTGPVQVAIAVSICLLIFFSAFVMSVYPLLQPWAPVGW
jgi:hypothetical protein